MFTHAEVRSILDGAKELEHRPWYCLMLNSAFTAKDVTLRSWLGQHDREEVRA